MAASEVFWHSFDSFKISCNAMQEITHEIVGKTLSGRQMRVAFLFTKLLVHMISLIEIVERFQSARDKTGLFDHFSICALGRVCTDAAVMTMYISEPRLKIDEWNLRRKVLYLHDLCSRKRFFGALGVGVNDGIEGGETLLVRLQQEMKQEIKQIARSLGRSDVDKISDGSIVFVDGIRGAVREAGWSIEDFEFQQAYLSNFVHSHPVSFMRAVEHKIDFYEPSEAQFAAANVALEVISSICSDVIERVRSFLIVVGDPLAHHFDPDGNQVV